MNVVVLRSYDLILSDFSHTLLVLFAIFGILRQVFALFSWVKQSLLAKSTKYLDSVQPCASRKESAGIVCTAKNGHASRYNNRRVSPDIYIRPFIHGMDLYPCRKLLLRSYLILRFVWLVLRQSACYTQYY